MKLKTLAIIIIAIAIGLVSYHIGTKPSSGPEGVNTLLIPKLSNQMNDVTGITIIKADNKLHAKINKSEKNWLVENKDNYVADIAMIRQVFTNLAEAKLIEPKSSNPENYSKLGVEDVSDISAQGVQVSIEGLGEELKFIAGNKGSSGDNSQYIRYVDSKQTWLINKNLDLDKDATNWLKKDLFDIPPEQIKSIQIAHNEGPIVKLENKGTEQFEFILLNSLSEGQEVSESEIYQVANALSSMKLTDVLLEDNVDKENAQKIITTFQTFDGLTIKVNSYVLEEKTFAVLNIEFDQALVDESKVKSEEGEVGSYAAVRSDPEAAKELADKMGLILNGWAYELPTIVQEALIKNLDNFALVDES